MNIKNYKALNLLGRVYLKEKDFENAIKYYKKAQELRQWDFGAHFGMGRTLYKKGDLDKALGELITANTIYTRKFELHYILGKIYYEKQEYEKALSQFEICNQLEKPDKLKIPEGEEVKDFIEKIKIDIKNSSLYYRIY